MNLNSKLKEFQAGFRSGYSTSDNIFILRSIAGTFLEQKKKLYVFFVDFKAAFDTIDRRALFYKLYNAGMTSKFGRVLENLYDGNHATVWNGDEMSEWFETSMGVKQGCPLSPNLFALFIDDLIDSLPGGIEFAGMAIKALLFADDVVLFAYSPATLQLMINRLSEYSGLWNLTVNLSKSKVMVFKKGSGRMSRNEQWFLNSEPIEVVRAYKYLGVIITSNLNMENHLKDKLIKAKSAISATWKKYFGNNLISHSVKYKVFIAVAESVMMYAAQTWGFEKYETVEKLLRFYVKRCFQLPINTPNYMINIETGLSPLFIKTLKLHVDYILKVLNMPSGRLPKVIALYTIQKKGLWYEKLMELADYCDVNLNLSHQINDKKVVKDALYDLVSKVDEKYRVDCINMATSSVHRSTYSILNHNLCEKNYFRAENSQKLISAIFKMRGELVRLNFIPHREDLPVFCTLCNLAVREDIIHFIGICPILKEVRRNFLGSDMKTETEVLAMLNCEEEVTRLYRYYIKAISYRKQILNEEF